MQQPSLEQNENEIFETLETEAPSARRSARFGAFIIDSVLIGVVSTLFAALNLGRVDSWAILLYFILAHKLKGQTLGKKVYNIRLISTDTQDGALNWKQAILRETIGRFLSTIFFSAGYLRALVSEDRKAWHDQISKTRVVEVDVFRAEEGSSFFKMMAVSVGSICAIVGGVAYVALFTSYPLKEFAKRLELSGAQISGIEGSLMKGFTLQNVAFQNEEIELDLSNVQVQYDLAKAFTDDHLLIDRVSVESGRVKAKSADLFSRNKKPQPEKPQPDAVDKRRTAQGKKKEVPKITVHRVDIANLFFEGPAQQQFQLKRFFIDEVSTADQMLTIDRVWVESDGFDVDLHALQLSPSHVRSRDISYFKLKAAKFPDRLRSDFDLQAKMDYEFKTGAMTKFDVLALSNKLRVVKTASGYQVTLQDFTPNTVIQKAPPVRNLNLTVLGAPTELVLKPPTGSFVLYTSPFVSQPTGEFLHQRGERTYKLAFSPATMFITPGAPSLVIDSVTHPNVEAWLSEIYFGKLPQSLSPAEAALIASDAPHFRLKPVPVQAMLPPPVPTLLVPIASIEACRSGKKEVCETIAPQLSQACREGQASACALIAETAQRRQRVPAQTRPTPPRVLPPKKVRQTH